MNSASKQCWLTNGGSDDVDKEVILSIMIYPIDHHSPFIPSTMTNHLRASTTPVGVHHSDAGQLTFKGRKDHYEAIVCSLMRILETFWWEILIKFDMCRTAYFVFVKVHWCSFMFEVTRACAAEHSANSLEGKYTQCHLFLGVPSGRRALLWLSCYMHLT